MGWHGREAGKLAAGREVGDGGMEMEDGGTY
jgi:hypothetical protein